MNVNGVRVAEVAGRGKVIALERRKRKWAREKDLGVFGGVTGVHPQSWRNHLECPHFIFSLIRSHIFMVQIFFHLHQSKGLALFVISPVDFAFQFPCLL